MKKNPILAETGQLRMGVREFVGLVAALMALNALAIDVMLPALPEIGRTLGVTEENQRQWIITSYLLGFGAAQLVWGTLADRFGRRPILLICLSSYILFSIASALAGSFTMMMVARILQGVASAAARVLAVSIVRDRYSGRQMARIMSLAFIVFLAVPILAPSIGQLIMLLAPWRWIFGVLGIWSTIVLIWVSLRLPETLHPEYRRPITSGHWLKACGMVLGERMSLGYTIALTLMIGGLFGFINSAQQIFFDVFDAPRMFTLIFACIAGTMALASLINSKIVERLGTRKVSHWAILCFAALSCLHALIAWLGHENIWSFSLFQAAIMGCFGLSSPNFGAMAMEPVGSVAGTAASLQGFISTVGGALIGFTIGQQFDGTTAPVAFGYAILGLLTLAAVLITEKGRLFRPQHMPAAA